MWVPLYGCSSPSIRMLLLVFSVLLLNPCCRGLVSDIPVSKLLEQYASDIRSLREQAAATLGVTSSSDDDGVPAPYSNDVFFLRYCLDCPDDAEGERTRRLKDNLEWRQSGRGREICRAALEAVQTATSSRENDKGWNNDPVLALAPHSSVVSEFFTTKSTITTTLEETGDLVYCIRAGQIDDVKLMDTLGAGTADGREAAVGRLVDFFLYAKEVNALVANDRSLRSDRLLSVLTANDLSGVKLIGGSADFRKALSVSSKQASALYPATAGPTLLLNLPPLLNALVKLFTPLFPPDVNARLKFARGPCIKDVATLDDISSGGSRRGDFQKEIRDVLSS